MNNVTKGFLLVGFIGVVLGVSFVIAMDTSKTAALEEYNEWCETLSTNTGEDVMTELTIVLDNPESTYGDLVAIYEKILVAYTQKTPPQEIQEYHNAILKRIQIEIDHMKSNLDMDTGIEQIQLVSDVMILFSDSVFDIRHTLTDVQYIMLYNCII